MVTFYVFLPFSKVWRAFSVRATAADAYELKLRDFGIRYAREGFAAAA